MGGLADKGGTDTLSSSNQEMTNQLTSGTTTGDRSMTGSQGLPDWVLPYLQQGFSGASQIAGSPLQYYPGQSYAGLDIPRAYHYTDKGADMLRAAAKDDRRYTAPLWKQIQANLRGDYLDPEYLRQRAQPGINAALGGINAGANLAGGRGSSLAAEAAGRAGADAMSRVYDSERGRQMQAAGMVPGMMDLMNRRGETYMRLGQMDLQRALLNQQNQQGQIDADMARFNFGQLEPLQRQQSYMNLLQGLLPYAGQETSQASDFSTTSDQMTQGETTSTGTQEQTDPSGGILGPLGSIAGYALGGPIGGAVGGGVGDLFGGGSTGMGLGDLSGGFDLFPTGIY